MGYNIIDFPSRRRSMSQNGSEIGFEMKHSGTQRLFEYWSDLRGGRSAPYKSEVTARGIGRTLASNTFVLENLPDGARRFRLAGSALHDLFGHELRGMSANAIVEQDQQARLRSLLDDCLAAPAVCVLQCEAHFGSSDAIKVEILLAPLRSDFDQMNRVLGAAHVLNDSIYDVAPAPRKCRITSARTLDFAGPNQFDADAPLPGFADPVSSFDFESHSLSAIEGGAKTGEPRRGHLKVVKD